MSLDPEVYGDPDDLPEVVDSLPRDRKRLGEEALLVGGLNQARRDTEES
jgi:hypothetical protein